MLCTKYVDCISTNTQTFSFFRKFSSRGVKKDNTLAVFLKNFSYQSLWGLLGDYITVGLGGEGEGCMSGNKNNIVCASPERRHGYSVF